MRLAQFGPRLRRQSVRAVALILQAVATRLGYTAIANDASSPIPRLRPPGDPEWRYRYPPHSIDVDLDPQLAFLERDLAPYIGEFAREVT
jgi:hypothetical protein